MTRPPQTHPGVVLSSTFKDLVAHRDALSRELLKARLLRIAMEDSVLTPGSDIITESLDMVEDATAYIGIISLRYGQVLTDPRNPNAWSVTRLEYERARALGRPTLMFVMDDTYPAPPQGREKSRSGKQKLADFRARVRENGMLYQSFSSQPNFKSHLGQIVARLATIIRATQFDPPEDWRHLPAKAPPSVLAALTLHAPEPQNAPGNYRISVSARFAPASHTDAKGRKIIVGLHRTRLAIELSGFQLAKDSLIGDRTTHPHITPAPHGLIITGPATGTPPLLQGDPFTGENLLVIEPGPLASNAAAGSNSLAVSLLADPVEDFAVFFAPTPDTPAENAGQTTITNSNRQATLAAIIAINPATIRAGRDIVLDSKAIRRRTPPR